MTRSSYFFYETKLSLTLSLRNYFLSLWQSSDVFFVNEKSFTRFWINFLLFLYQVFFSSLLCIQANWNISLTARKIFNSRYTKDSTDDGSCRSEFSAQVSTTDLHCLAKLTSNFWNRFSRFWDMVIFGFWP